MYGALRLLVSNYITAASQITLSSQANGSIGGVVKSGSGVARMTVSGPYQGAYDLTFEVVCDSVSAGASVGEATIKWRNSLTADGAWEQTGITTQTTPAIALSADGLGTNLSISFVGSVGDDFALGDSRKFVVKANYGPERMIDRNRNTAWRSTGVAQETITIDNGSAVNTTCALLHDHNLTDTATVTLEANATDSWATPSFSESITTITDPLYAYIDESYRYFRWVLVDSANTDGYIQAANIMHTAYDSLEKQNGIWGSSEIPGMNIQGNESLPGVVRRYWYANQQNLTLNFGETLSNNDVDELIEIQQTLKNADTKRLLPLWVHFFSDISESLRLMHWVNIGQWKRTYRSVLLNSNTSLIFDEAPKV